MDCIYADNIYYVKTAFLSEPRLYSFYKYIIDGKIDICLFKINKYIK